jgi:hypothetical protein
MSGLTNITIKTSRSELCKALGEQFEKAHVKAHTRTTKLGKMVEVKEHEDKRQRHKEAIHEMKRDLQGPQEYKRSAQYKRWKQDLQHHKNAVGLEHTPWNAEAAHSLLGGVARVNENHPNKRLAGKHVWVGGIGGNTAMVHALLSNGKKGPTHLIARHHLLPAPNHPFNVEKQKSEEREKKKAQTPKNWSPEKVAKKLVREMELDNDMKATTAPKHMKELTSAVKQMMRAGLKPTHEFVELVAGGDQDETESKYDKYHGYKWMDKVLEKIFNEE